MSDSKKEQDPFLKRKRLARNNKVEKFPTDRKECLPASDKGCCYNQETCWKSIFDWACTTSAIVTQSEEVMQAMTFWGDDSHTSDECNEEQPREVARGVP